MAEFNTETYFAQNRSTYNGIPCIDIGLCRLPWSEDEDFRWMINQPFTDIYGKRLFDITDPHEGPYETEDVRLSSGMVVMDVGANLGLFSALACSLGCRVYAFEPLDRNVYFLSLLKELNPGFDLTICQCVLSNYNGRAVLQNQGRDMGGGTIAQDIADLNRTKDPRKVVITRTNAITMDTFVEVNNLHTVDFIKADIEGAEVSMIEGAKDTLARFKPVLSLCSYHRATDPETLESLILGARSDYRVIKGNKKIYAV